MQPQRCNLPGLARLLAVCALAALMLVVSLLISLQISQRVSAQSRTQDVCHAKAINDSGMVGGDCFGASAPHAVLWDLWDNTLLYLPAIKRQAR
jgi:hypothetical protein